MYDIYLYGMVLLTESLLLKGDYPEADGYGEILERHTVTGGETGTCATILATLRASVKVDGNHMGRETYGPVKEFYEGLGVDISALTYDPAYKGLTDMVLIAGSIRTCLGEFQQYFSDPENGRWNAPDREHIKNARVAGIDPFFFSESEAAARYCAELGRPYVTIDCKYDTALHALSAVNVLSSEFIRWQYPDTDAETLLREYAAHTSGLTVITSGAGEILYGRGGGGIRRFAPYRVEVASTLGAGDSFKAGAVYGLLKGMDDADLVAFASATAAAAVSRYPIPKYPPTLEKIRRIMDGRE